jgi:hypothetical protein
MESSNRHLLLQIGQAQVDAMFARQEAGPVIDDAEFLPLVEAVLTAFEDADIGSSVVDELWEYAFAAYDRMCKEHEPASTTAENRELMQSYFLGKRRLKRRRR